MMEWGKYVFTLERTAGGQRWRTLVAAPSTGPGGGDGGLATPLPPSPAPSSCPCAAEGDYLWRRWIFGLSQLAGRLPGSLYSAQHRVYRRFSGQTRPLITPSAPPPCVLAPLFKHGSEGETSGIQIRVLKRSRDVYGTNWQLCYSWNADRVFQHIYVFFNVLYFLVTVSLKLKFYFIRLTSCQFKSLFVYVVFLLLTAVRLFSSQLLLQGCLIHFFYSPRINNL